MIEPRTTATRTLTLVEHYLRLDPIERRRAFLSTRDAARELGVAQRTLQTWIVEGKLEAVRVGGRYLIEVDSLTSFVRNAMDEG